MGGPLRGLRVVEFDAIGPVPFAGMLLADLGSDVVRVNRVDDARLPLGHPLEAIFAGTDFLGRGRRRLSLDLKQEDGLHCALALIDQADVLLEGFRPGVAERLGIGPDVCLSRNPRLIYGRMTGWGQDGPLAAAAGHDINYIALAGLLDVVGRAGQPPSPPLNLLGDFASGTMFLLLGVLGALWERERSGRGQVVDAAIVDGAAVLNVLAYYFRSLGAWGDRGTNLVDSGAYFYDVYETADGRYVSVGAIEPGFHAELLTRLGIDDVPPSEQFDAGRWQQRKSRLAEVFRTKSLAEWCSLLEGTDACVAPVLTMDEAPFHPHNVARGTYVEVGESLQPAPAPRLSRTVPIAGDVARPPGSDTDAVLREIGCSDSEIADLRARGVVG